MSISEAAIVLGTSTHAIRCQVRAGKLEAREEHETLYVRLTGPHADAPSASTSSRLGDPALSQQRAAERARVWKGLMVTAAVLVLGSAAGGLVYRVLEARHKQSITAMLHDNARANRQLADQLEEQHLQSISLARQLHEERLNVKRSADNVARLSSQVDAASARLAQLEKELTNESAKRQALVAQRVDLIKERDRLTDELAEMMKHLTVARKQLKESEYELSQARSRLDTLQTYPQASPLPREMIENSEYRAPARPSAAPSHGSPENVESSIGSASGREPFNHLRNERRNEANTPQVSDQPRLITVVPDDSTSLSSK